MNEPRIFLQRLGVIVFVAMLCLASISCSKMGESVSPLSDVAVKGLKTNWKEEMLFIKRPGGGLEPEGAASPQSQCPIFS